MSSFNPEIFSTSVSSGLLPNSTVRQYGKRARVALEDSGYPEGSTFSPSPNSSTGEVSTTNYSLTYTYQVAPYVLSFNDANGMLVQEQKDWVSKLPVSTLVMANDVSAHKKGNASRPASVLLTLPQLNYQLHCMMQGYCVEAESAVRGIANRDQADATFHDNMLAKFRLLMNEAATWTPAGVNQTHPSYPIASGRAGRTVPLVVQCGGVAHVQNIWGANVGQGSVLYVRLSAFWFDGRRTMRYKLSEKEVGVVSPVLGTRWYLLPRFDAVVNNAGRDIDHPDVLGFKIYSEPVDSIKLRTAPFSYGVAVFFPIGVCFDASAIHRSKGGLRCTRPDVLDVVTQEVPGMTNGIQVLLTGTL